MAQLGGFSAPGPAFDDLGLHSDGAAVTLSSGAGGGMSAAIQPARGETPGWLDERASGPFGHYAEDAG
jgi:hypothetical protein